MLAEGACHYCYTGWDRHDLIGRRIVAFSGSRAKHWLDLETPTRLVERSITRLLGKYGDAGLFVKVGDATGVDALVIEACQYFGVCYETLRADWKAHGSFAGHERNGRVLEGADELIAISRPGQWPTAGTGDAIRQAQQLHIPVHIWRGRWLKPAEVLTSLSASR